MARRRVPWPMRGLAVALSQGRSALATPRGRSTDGGIGSAVARSSLAPHAARAARDRAPSPGGTAPRGRWPRGRSSTIGMPALDGRGEQRADAASSPRKPSSIVPSASTTAEATSGSAANQSRAAATPRHRREQPDAQHRAEAQPPLDVRDTSLGQDLPAVDDRDAGAQLLELGEDVAADHDRLAERPQLAQELAQLDAGARVEAGGGLVEQQHLRIVDQRVGEAQPLLHAARQASGRRRRACRARSTSSSRSPIIRRRPAGGDAVAPREEVEVLPDLHVVVDPEDVRHEAEDAPHLIGVPGDGPARDLRVSRRRPKQRREHPERRRLARAVRADEPEDLAVLDRRSMPATASVPS